MRRLLLLAVACTSDPKTLADGCYDVASAYCQKAQSCGVLSGTLDSCRTSGTQGCCAGVDCGRPVEHCQGGVPICCGDPGCNVAHYAVDVGVFQRCEQGISNLSCGELAAGLVPVNCVPDAGQ